MSQDQRETLFPIALARALKAARVERAMSQEELGERSGIHRTAIARLEAGLKGNPTIGSLARLSAALGMRTSELIAKAEQIEALMTKAPEDERTG